VKRCVSGQLQETNCKPAPGAEESCRWLPVESRYTCTRYGSSSEPTGQYRAACPGTAEYACEGKVCGWFDGQGKPSATGQGFDCGAANADKQATSCAAGQMCSATLGKCVCAPKCSGKACGPDGCGGTCGACGIGLECTTTGKCGCSTDADCGGGACLQGKCLPLEQSCGLVAGDVLAGVVGANFRGACVSAGKKGGYVIAGDGTLLQSTNGQAPAATDANTVVGANTLTSVVQCAVDPAPEQALLRVYALRADGTVAERARAGTSLVMPSNLTTSTVKVRRLLSPWSRVQCSLDGDANPVCPGGAGFMGVLRSDGTARFWGTTGTVPAALTALEGVKTYRHFQLGQRAAIGVTTAGKLEVIALDGICSASATTTPVISSPIIDVDVTGCDLIALTSKGEVFTWGDNATAPPNDLGKVVDVTAGETFGALLASGRTRRWPISAQFDSYQDFAGLKTIYRMSDQGLRYPLRWVSDLEHVTQVEPGYVTRCGGQTHCAAVSRTGCCLGDKRYTCGAFGELAATTCDTGCGWSSATLTWACGGEPDYTPALGAFPAESCVCVPSCKPGSCGSDGCGGFCGAEGAACDDSDICTTGETCSKGACVAQSRTTCDDGNACTADTCMNVGGKATCVNSPLPEQSKCNDNDTCTVSDACVGGKCSGAPLTCDDANPCTSDTCNPTFKGGGCLHKAAIAPCSDGNACTIGDACNWQYWEPTKSGCNGAGVLSCDDGNPCTTDTCDPVVGCLHAAGSQGAACDDGSSCTTGDVCKAGKCSGTGAVSCDDGNPCTLDPCVAGGCAQHLFVAAGTPCSTGDACRGAGQCGSGSCVAPVIDCSDTNPCTTDSCSPTLGCQHSPAAGVCNDGNLCTVGDTCVQGVCKGQSLVCDDSNACTVDSCGAEQAVAKGTFFNGCKNEATYAQQGKACGTAGACGPAPTCSISVVQPPDAPSYLAGNCVAPATGTITCDDTNPCTDDYCDPKKGCAVTFNTRQCDDGNPCTLGDHCQQGTCAGGQGSKCDDKNPCTADTCDSALGCTHKGYPLSAAVSCDDGDPCTVGDKCAADVFTPGSLWQMTGCKPGAAKVCNDGNECTADSCVAGGCVNVPTPGQSCNDADACTSPDRCSSTGKCQGVSAKVCDDKNPCTLDTCNKATGACVSTPTLGLACDDQNFCTVGDACDATGFCKPGSPRDCGKGPNACTSMVCSASDASCFADIHSAYGKACDDGNACTVSDVCNAGACGGRPSCPSLETLHINGFWPSSQLDWTSSCQCAASGTSAAVSCPTGKLVSWSGKNGPDQFCCTPKCSGKQCGSDGCGGMCGSCAADETCTAAGLCLPAKACFGKAGEIGSCCDGNTVATCAWPNTLTKVDCATKGMACGWTGTAFGCTATPAQAPPGTAAMCPGSTCTPKCAGKECGSDGCGGVCGTCKDGKQCSASRGGKCALPCDGEATTLGCATKTLAGYVLSYCPSSLDPAPVSAVTQVTCDKAPGWHWITKNDGSVASWSGRYECGGDDDITGGTGTSVTPSCPTVCSCGVGQAMRQCGDNGCGGSCGTCGNGQVCQNGFCKSCPDGCWGKQCGCSAGQVCSQATNNCCSPSCSGKTCGPDGCGGVCGTCPGGAECSASGVCVADCGATTATGECRTDAAGDLAAYYCTDTKLAKVLCACVTESELACPGCKADVTCAITNVLPRTCSTSTCAFWEGAACQCDVECATRGDCCSNFDATCAATLFPTSCGDGACQAASGETSSTCAADCPKPPAVTGRLDAPWPQRIVYAGRAGARAEWAVSPTDDVRPSAPPVSRDQLLAWVPALGINAGSPRTTLHTLALKGGATLAPLAKGATGPGFSTRDGDLSRFAALRVVPDAPFRASASHAGRTTGGFTAAAFIRVPVASNNWGNALGSALALAGTSGSSAKDFEPGLALPLPANPLSFARERCVLARPFDTSIHTLGEGPIIGVQAYFGGVNALTGLAAIGSLRDCGAYRAVPRTFTCLSDIQALAESTCLGKTSCSIPAWQAVKALQGCTTPENGRLMLRVVTGETAARHLNLSVRSLAEGGQLELTVADPSGRRVDLLSGSPFPRGEWAHVAVSFEPLAPAAEGALQAGELSVYLNGERVAVAQHVAVDPLWAWDWGAATITGGANPLAKVGSDSAAVADYDDALLYARALSRAEVGQLAGRTGSAVAARVWPSVEASVMAANRLWTVGGNVKAVPVAVPWLRDASASTAANDVAVVADFDGVSVAPGATTEYPAGGADLDGLTSWTFAGWLRPGALTADQTLLEVKQGASARVRLATSSASVCGGRGLVVTFPDGTQAATPGCDHVLANGEWLFVVVSANGAQRFVSLDGAAQSVVVAGAASAPLFAGDVTGARTVVQTAAADLGWLTLLPSFPGASVVHALRSTGPDVWLDGAVGGVTGTPAGTPRDWASFHNTAVAGPTDRPSTGQGATGAVIANGTTNFSASTSGAGYVRIPARGRLSPTIPVATTAGLATSGTPRTFTVSERARIATLASGASLTYRLFELADVGKAAAWATLRCSGLAEGGQQCKVLAARRLASGSVARFTSPPFVLTVPGASAEFGLALSFADATTGAGDRPILAVTLPSGDADLAATDPVAKVPKSFKDAGRWLVTLDPYTPGPGLDAVQEPEPTFAAADGSAFFIPGRLASGVAGPTGVYDVRVYGRALTFGQLVSASASDCERLGCDDALRVCLTPPAGAALALAACGGCATGAAEHGGVCAPKAGFLDECLTGDECASGLCGNHEMRTPAFSPVNSICWKIVQDPSLPEFRPSNGNCFPTGDSDYACEQSTGGRGPLGCKCACPAGYRAIPAKTAVTYPASSGVPGYLSASQQANLESGTYQVGRGVCLEASATPACVAACGLRGRQCQAVAVAQKSPPATSGWWDGHGNHPGVYPSTSHYGCGECATDFQPKPGGEGYTAFSGSATTDGYHGYHQTQYGKPDAVSAVDECLWAPTLEAPDVCVRGSQCKSGLCVDRSEQSYAVTSDGCAPTDTAAVPSISTTRCAKAAAGKPSTVKVCAAAVAATCDEVDMNARQVKSVPKWDGTTADGWVCEGCRQVPYEGKNLYRSARSLLTPQACEAIYKNAAALTTTGAVSLPLTLVWGGDDCKYTKKYDTVTKSGVWVGDRFYERDIVGLLLDPARNDTTACTPAYAEWWTFANALAGGPTPRYGHVLTQADPPLALLRRVALKDESPGSDLQPKTLASLQKSGVGDVLIGWEKLPPEVRAQYGSLELYQCNSPVVSGDPTAESPYWDGGRNAMICVADKYPDGTTCPPPESVGKPGWERPVAGKMCDSGFCAADTHRCEAGQTVIERSNGKSRADSKKGQGDGSKLPISLQQNNGSMFRFDRTTVDTELGPDGNPLYPDVELTDGDHRHYVLEAHAINTISVFGSAPIYALDFGTELDATPGLREPDEEEGASAPPADPPATTDDELPEVATFDQHLAVFGYEISVPIEVKSQPPWPGPVPKIPPMKTGACSGPQFKDGQLDESSECKPKRTPIGVAVEKNSDDAVKEGNTTELGDGEEKEDFVDSGELDLLTIEIPIPGQDCPGEEGLFLVAPRACFSKNVMIGPVPAFLEAKAEPTLSIAFGAILDTETYEPAFKVTPSVGLAVEVKAGVGTEIGPIEVKAGVKAAITVIEVGLPITIGLAFDKATELVKGAQKELQDLWIVKDLVTVSLELTFLKLALSLFFEMDFKVFTMEIEQVMFEFDGIKLAWKLGEFGFNEHKVDFQWDGLSGLGGVKKPAVEGP
jgi:hypothetical protein